MLEPQGDRDEFERCWPWLWASLCEFGPTHNKAQVWARIAAGKAFLWPGDNCVVLGEFYDHPIGLRDFNYWLQGGELDELKELHDGIEAWAAAKGCHRITGKGRDGWVRAMNGAWQKGPTTRTKWLDKPASQAVGTSAQGEFERCWPWLESGIVPYGRTHSKDDLWKELCNQSAFLFSASHSAAVCRVTQYPTGLKSLDIWLSGGNLGQIREQLYPSMEAWAKKIGCHRMTAFSACHPQARNGWLSHGPRWVKSLMGPRAGTPAEIKVLGYSERVDP